MTLLDAFLNLTLFRVKVILTHVLLEERSIHFPSRFLPRIYLLDHRLVNGEALVVSEGQVGYARDQRDETAEHSQ